MTSLVDWALAERIIRAGAGDGPAAMAGEPDLGEVHGRAERAVLEYTGLVPLEPLPRAEWVSRREWAMLNLHSMRELIAPLEQRLEESFSGPAAGVLRGMAGRVIALELSGLLVLASKRVLGQYEFPLLGGEREPRLVFVGPNLDDAAGKLGGEPDDVLAWVALHEGTHAIHFGAAPWLRGHLGGLATTVMAASPPEITVRDLLERARRVDPAEIRRFVSGLAGRGPEQGRAGLPADGLVGLLAPESSRESIAEVQATMAAIEGYAEHVMDAAAGPLAPVVADLRAAMERRRDSASGLVRFLSWLLGLEMKLRQYRDGKRFADEVVAAAGIEGLNRAWTGPSSLPTEQDLTDPRAWLARVS